MPRVLAVAQPLVNSSETQVASGLERRHPELLGEAQSRREVVQGLTALRILATAGDLAEEVERARLVAARSLMVREIERLLGVLARLGQPAGREMRLARVDENRRM